MCKISNGYSFHQIYLAKQAFDTFKKEYQLNFTNIYPILKISDKPLYSKSKNTIIILTKLEIFHKDYINLIGLPIES